MALKIRRGIETKRAPERKSRYGSYTPSGIDIYTTDDPELVKLDAYDHRVVRIADLLTILDELDRYESRRKLDGEKMDIQLHMVKPESEKGNVYHRPGWMLAEPDPERKGLVCLNIFSHDSFGSIALIADRASLRKALEDSQALAEIEREDRQRGHET